MTVWTALVASMDGPLVPVLKGAVPLEVSGATLRLVASLPPHQLH